MAEQSGLSFKTWRILFLLFVLVAIVGWGIDRQRGLDRRTDWEAPVRLTVVIVEEEPVDPALITALGEEAKKAEAWFRAEMSRYRDDVVTRPVLLSVAGPVAQPKPPPVLPPYAEYADVVRFTWDFWRWRQSVDQAVGEMPESDSRVYVIVRSATMEEDAERFFEGLAEQGGEVGLVSIDLAQDMVHLAMMTSVHEFLHTIGATDKYSADGSAMIPLGLGDPDATVRFPQRAAEVMARNVVISPDEERLPINWDELVVGPHTANEIGWTR